MANNVTDAAIRLRDLFTPTVRSVNTSLGTMKTQMAAAKQSVSGLSDKLTEHERIQKRTTQSTCKSADFRLRPVPANGRKCVRNRDIQVLVPCQGDPVSQ